MNTFYISTARLGASFSSTVDLESRIAQRFAEDRAEVLVCAYEKRIKNTLDEKAQKIFEEYLVKYAYGLGYDHFDNGLIFGDLHVRNKAVFIDTAEFKSYFDAFIQEIQGDNPLQRQALDVDILLRTHIASGLNYSSKANAFVKAYDQCIRNNLQKPNDETFETYLVKYASRLGNHNFDNGFLFGDLHWSNQETFINDAFKRRFDTFIETLKASENFGALPTSASPAFTQTINTPPASPYMETHNSSVIDSLSNSESSSSSSSSSAAHSLSSAIDLESRIAQRFAEDRAEILVCAYEKHIKNTLEEEDQKIFEEYLVKYAYGLGYDHFDNGLIFGDLHVRNQAVFINTDFKSRFDAFIQEIKGDNPLQRQALEADNLLRMRIASSLNYFSKANAFVKAYDQCIRNNLQKPNDETFETYLVNNASRLGNDNFDNGSLFGDLDMSTQETYSAFKQCFDAFIETLKSSANFHAPPASMNIFNLDPEIYKKSRESLEKGIEISDAVRSRLYDIFPFLSEENTPDNAIIWLRKCGSYVFKIEGIPNLIFKLPKVTPALSMYARFENMIMGEYFCKTKELSHLIIPRAKMLSIERDKRHYHFIVEQALELDPSCDRQTELYSSEFLKNSKIKNILFEKSIRQLIDLIKETGLSDIWCANIPITNDGFIALVDMEYFHNIEYAFLGVPAWRHTENGLINIMPTPELVEIACQTARGLGLDRNIIEELKQKRINHLKLIRTDFQNKS
jgi:hypothetical protein